MRRLHALRGPALRGPALLAPLKAPGRVHLPAGDAASGKGLGVGGAPPGVEGAPLELASRLACYQVIFLPGYLPTSLAYTRVSHGNRRNDVGCLCSHASVRWSQVGVCSWWVLPCRSELSSGTLDVAAVESRAGAVG